MITILRGALAALGGMTLACVPARAEVVESSADHFVTRDSVVVAAAPKASWLALIDPAEWWDESHTWSGSAANLSLAPQAGGCFCERLPEKDSATEVGLAGSAQHMTVVMAEPMKVLRMRGALGPLQSEPVDGVLTITMQPVAGGTKLVWEYVVAGHMRYPVPKISASVDEVMSQQLGHLADKLRRAGAPPANQAPVAKPAPKGVGEQRTSDDVGAAIDALDEGKGD
ncbi:hypothetical protein GCM10011515_07810 [Tsuneonella deserti]|uniref:Polyketide cyclase / dehydrase and lipid transport n=1 Tax=Tsuneonella deserti TaxID=2035528 RepID=A0ABQ1S4H9_9SPHN|nr:SRPBCC family protein [Tsuneonella deserti]GGD90583.1 hypothetical protein GCM10011515_07810 [Tsuneonella deserti]